MKTFFCGSLFEAIIKNDDLVTNQMKILMLKNRICLWFENAGKILLLFSCLLISISALAQPYRYTFEAGGGVSWFDAGYKKIHKFPTAECRISGLVTRKLNRSFSLATGLTAGLKTARERLHKGPPFILNISPTHQGKVVPDVLDKTGSGTHAFIGLPILLQYKTTRLPVRLAIGGLYRYWFSLPTGLKDALDNQNEVCFVMRVSYIIRHNIVINIDYLSGLTTFLKAQTVDIEGNRYNYKVHNAAVSLSVSVPMKIVFRKLQ